MDKVQLDLNVVLPDIDECDGCVHLLTDRLASVKGIEEAHITQENGKTEHCLHYDPNLLTLSRVQRLAEDAGAVVGSRYRH